MTEINRRRVHKKYSFHTPHFECCSLPDDKRCIKMLILITILEENVNVWQGKFFNFLGLNINEN